MHVARTNGIQVTRKRTNWQLDFLWSSTFWRKDVTGKVHSELHILQIRFQIRSLYHHKDLQIEDQGQFILNRKFWELSVLPWRAMKKMCWMSQQGTEKSIFREIFRIGCDVIMKMILQNTIFTFNLFEMESFDNCLCYVGNKRRSFRIFCKLSVLSFELASTLSLH